MAANAKPGWAQANGEPVALAGYVQNTWDMREPENPRRLDQILQGQSITTYTHQKSGTVHALAGPAGARYIRWDMTATAEYGDSWTLNSEPVVVVYCDGNPILPHSLITGDMLIGAVGTGKVALTIPTPKPNENILDNWYFADPINQRGQTEYTASGYGIDRWQKTSAQGKVTVGEGVTELTGTGAYGYLRQYVENVSTLTWPVTLSVMTQDGAVYSKTFLGPSATGFFIGTFYFYLDGDSRVVVRFPADTTSVNITAIKLEEGPRQTLARQDADDNWVLLDPLPNKATELMKCQRYYQHNVTGEAINLPAYIAATANSLVIGLTYPVPMRATPRPIWSQSPYIRNQNDGSTEDISWLEGAIFNLDDQYLGIVYNPAEGKNPFQVGVPYGFMLSLSAEL